MYLKRKGEAVVCEISQKILETINELYRNGLSLFSMIISLFALFVTIYINILQPQKKNLKANLVWDEIENAFYIIIKNTGGASLVIDSVELFIKKNEKEIFCLGKRLNLWSVDEKAVELEKGKAVNYKPILGSIYDVFAFKGHVDVALELYTEKVYIKVKELYGKCFISETSFCLSDIYEKISN